MIRRYATPLAFKQALEQRIKSSSTTGADFARRRQLLVFDRFLARVVSVVGDAVTLKGGLVLEMRLVRARTTKDVDLRMMGSADNVLERLQAAGRLDLGDYMSFEVQPDVDHPEIRNEGMQYDGYRYPCPHHAEEPAQHSRERPPGYRSARHGRRDQRGGAPLGARADVPISRDSLSVDIGPCAASLLGRPLCCNGCDRRADLEDSRGCD